MAQSAPHARHARDSGYFTQATTPEISASECCHMAANPITSIIYWLRRRMRAPPLQEYDGPISSAARIRFCEIVDHIDEALCTWLGPDESRCRLISIKLKVMGRDRSTAKPCIVVLCHHTDLRRVTDFFAQEQIRDQFQPRNQRDDDETSFHLIVGSRPPHLTATCGSTEVYAEAMLQNMSLCGAIITTGTDVLTRRARIGGAVMVKSHDGSQMIYAMTAGHIFNKEDLGPQDDLLHSLKDKSGPDPDISNNTANGEDEDGDCYIFLVDDFPDDHLKRKHKLDASIKNKDLGIRDLEANDNKRSIHQDRGSSRATKDRVLKTQVGRGPVELIRVRDAVSVDLDYALIEINDPSRLRQSASLELPKNLNPLTQENSGTRDVKLLLPDSDTGYRAGKLTMSTSFLKIGSSRRFVETYILNLEDINFGDSGVWVIEVAAKIAWGHVVAADDLGDVYVIPLDNTLQQMKIRLDASEVTLPTRIEMEKWIEDYQRDNLGHTPIPDNLGHTPIPDDESRSPTIAPSSPIFGKIDESYAIPNPDEAVMSPDQFSIGWICALNIELAASMAMLDHEYTQVQKDPWDVSAYHWGRIFGHNVVMTCLGHYGLSNAAVAGDRMRAKFRNLRFILMVGIGGGVQENGVELGDIVISKPGDNHGGVIQYDIGKVLEDGSFVPTMHLNSPPDQLINLLQSIQARSMLNDSTITKTIETAFKKHEAMREKFRRPPDPPESSRYGKPKPHYGLICSGNRVIKSEEELKRLQARIGKMHQPEPHILCFEMEAAGLMNTFPCLVIRGISDYCDSKKNDKWQPYAAIAAAAFAKELLQKLTPTPGRPDIDPKIKQDTGSSTEIIPSNVGPYRTETTGSFGLSTSPLISDNVPLYRTDTTGSFGLNASPRSSDISSLSIDNPKYSPKPANFVFEFHGKKNKVAGPSYEDTVSRTRMRFDEGKFGFKGYENSIFMRSLKDPLLETPTLPPTSPSSQEVPLIIPLITLRPSEDTELQKAILQWAGTYIKNVKFSKDHSTTISGSIKSGDPLSQKVNPVKVNVTFRVISTDSHLKSLKDGLKAAETPFAVICFRLQKDDKNNATNLSAEWLKWRQKLMAMDKWNPPIIMLGMTCTSFGVRPQKAQDPANHLLWSLDQCVQLSRECEAAMYVEMATRNGFAQDNLFTILIAYATALSHGSAS